MSNLATLMPPWTKETAPRKGRPKACKGFADALARHGKMPIDKLIKCLDRKNTMPAEELVALRMVINASEDSPNREDIKHYLDRLIGKPRQTIDLGQGADQEPLVVKIIDARVNANRDL